MGTPLVSISCITYNHAPYIRECLDGFITQRTNFPFEILIHDDCSTDGTTEIIKEYAGKYPDIIKPMYEEINQYQNGKPAGSAIWNFPRARGKYIAMCEGDDYWTDPLKLQKQVDFLESHPDYSMCFHSAVVHYENSDKEDHLFSTLETREYDIKENMDDWIVATASLVYRKSVLESPCYKEYRKSKKFVVGDYPLILSCAKVGRLYCFKEPMSVYRLQPTGWTQQKNLGAKMALKLIEQEVETMRIFGGYSNVIGPKKIAKHSRAATSLLLKGKIGESFRVFRIAFKYAPKKSLIANFKFFFSMISNKR